MSDARDFLLGFLLSSTLFLATFASYILFCPEANKAKEPTTVNQYIILPNEPMLQSQPILPRQKINPFVPKKDA